MRYIICVLIFCVGYSTNYADNCDSLSFLYAIDESVDFDNTCAHQLLASKNELVHQSQLIEGWMLAIKMKSISAQVKIKYFNQLVSICQSNPSYLISDSKIHYEIGKQYYSQLEDYPSAISSFQKGFSSAQHEAHPDSILMARCLSAKGSSEYYLEDHRASELTLRRLVDRAWPMSEMSRAGSYQTLGNIYKGKGNISLAENYFLKSGQHYLNARSDSAYLAIYAWNSIGVLHSDFAHYDKSILAYNKALGILIHSENSALNATRWKRNIRRSLANDYSRSLRLDEALSIHHNLLAQYPTPNSTTEFIGTLLSISAIHIQTNDILRTQAILDKIEPLLQINKDPELHRLYQDREWRLHVLRENFNQAFVVSKVQLYDDCKIKFKEVFQRTTAKSNNVDNILLLKDLQKIADIYQARYRVHENSADADSAFILYERALHALDEVKMNQLDPDFSADLGALSTNLLSGVLSLSLQKKDTISADAFYTFFEKTKSASLLASIHANQFEDVFLKSYPILNTIYDTKNDITTIEHKLMDETIPSARQELSTQLDKLNQNLILAKEERLSLLTSDGKLGRLYEHKSLTSIQSALRTDACVLSYFITPDKSQLYIMKIESNDISLIQRNLPQAFTENIFSLIHSDPNSDDEKANWLETNYQISQLLLGDLLATLPSHLMIISDDVLAYLPFEMLLTRRSSTKTSYRSLPYLIKEKTISYNFSASIWKEMVDKKILGNGILTMAPEFTLASTFDESRSTTALPLAFAKKEVETIQEIFKHSTNFKPTNKQEFIRDAQRASIIHFAGHATLNDQKTENSFLAFSSNPTVDEKLFIREMYNLSIPSHLVVLSACNTGQGEIKKGEGVMSMARAFAYAGAKSLVYSLWKVNDISTGLIMQDFYRELKAGETKDVALRTAKLNYLDRAPNRLQHPYHWAGFVAMGDMSPIHTNGFISTWWVIGLLLLLLVGVGWWYFWCR